MDRTKIKGSSNIAEIGYDKDLETLEIKFQSGGVYRYWPVSVIRYKALLKAESKGGYFSKYIRKDSTINFNRVDELQSDSK